MSSLTNKAIFFDRDGVLNFDSGYVYKSNDCKLAPDLGSNLVQLANAGYLLFVVTNQSGVARGLYQLSDVEMFNDELVRLLSKIDSKLKFSEIYVCPHLPEGTVPQFSIACRCRKPGTLFIEQAREKYQLNLLQSWFIGDRDSDIECGLAGGLSTIQVKTFGIKQYKLNPNAHLVCKSLTEATQFILNCR